MHGRNDFRKAVSHEEPDHVLHRGTVAHRQHWLGDVARQRPEPRTLSSGHDHGLGNPRAHGRRFLCEPTDPPRT